MAASLASRCTTASPNRSRSGPVSLGSCLFLILGRPREALSIMRDLPSAIATSAAGGSPNLMDRWLSLMGTRAFGLARWDCTVAFMTSVVVIFLCSFLLLLLLLLFEFLFVLDLSEIVCSLHYTTVQLGSPGMKFMVALDTGSDLFWVPCDCSRCAPTEGSPYASVCSS